MAPTVFQDIQSAALPPLTARGWVRAWPAAFLILTAGVFAFMLASDNYERDAGLAQTVTCEVFTRGPAVALEATLSYHTLDRRPQSFRSAGEPAGSAGQLAHYQFTLPLYGATALGLRAPGKVETIRFYTEEGQGLGRLSAEKFQTGPVAHTGGFTVILPDPFAWASLAQTPAPPAPPAWRYLTTWGLIYTIIFAALGFLGVQLFAPGRTFDLRRFDGQFRALTALAGRMTPLALGLAVGLALAMAIVSAGNAHPDEYQHVAAARFYHDGGWLPPSVGDPRARDAIGPNGLSYHQDLDFVYLFAGKAALLTDLIAARPDLALRLVNVALFAGLALLACRRGRRAFAWTLLICPQVWYVCSYFNGDAMGLFLSALIVWQLAAPGSLLARSLGQAHFPWRAVVWMGLLLGLISISKKNFFPLPLLAGGFALWQAWQGPELRRRLLVRWTAIIALALGLYGLRVGYDQSLYGFHKTERVRAIAESLATPEFRPSQVREPGAHWYMGLRDRGVPVVSLVEQPRWREESFMSFAGMYGWMTIGAPPEFYRAMKYLYLAFGAALLFEWLRRSTRDELPLGILCLGLCAATAAASVYYSWTVAFQPQGRYLFPMLPILALFGLRRPEIVRAPAPLILGGLLFCASVYSFVFVALAQIPK